MSRRKSFRMVTLALTLLLIPMTLFVVSCANDEKKPVPTNCPKRLWGRWNFDFSAPMDLNFILTATHTVAADPKSCEIALQDLGSVDKGTFIGYLDGDRLEAVARAGGSWVVRGTVGVDPNGVPAGGTAEYPNPNVINGFWELGPYGGTFQARLLAQVTPTPTPLPFASR